MKKIISVCVSILVASAVFAADAERVWNSEDTAPAIRVYNGYTDNISIQCGTNAMGNVIITDGTTSSNIMNQGLLTVAQVVTYMSAYTNASGERLLTVDYYGVLAADSTSNLFLVAAITNKPGKWTTALKVDTSQAKFHSTYLPGATLGGSGTRKVLTDIYGDIGGTGNITLSAYANGTKVYQKTIVSPVYVWAAITGVTNLNTTDDVSPGYIHEQVNIPFNGSESIMIRGARATTATTGGIGASIKVLE
jgi:hypothetical protein